MKYLVTLLTTVVVTISSLSASAETSLLFIGNSFTYAYGSAAKFYRADSVTDLNNEGIGGVPALFKSFADQAGLDYDV
ncbi:PEP-CTERM sorting domain-containing protein, partial [Gammaproteobacteria bacterium]|nr:PEP-CTERM sorting domain-containing protein [Gammaproteobacteria bacterium]